MNHVRRRNGRSRRGRSFGLSGFIATTAVLGGGLLLGIHPAVGPEAARPTPGSHAVASAPKITPARASAPVRLAWFDPPSLSPALAGMGQGAPLSPIFVARAPQASIVVAKAGPAPSDEPEAPIVVAANPDAEPAQGLALAWTVPIPAPRPPEFDVPDTPPPSNASMPRRRMARVAPRAVPPVATADNRSVFEKLFGLNQPVAAALAYAAPGGSVRDRLQSVAAEAAVTPSDRYTAIYDISAKTVYLPGGNRLEAHSGLGPLLDDPRNVHVRMRGATPPSVYNLTLREQLFHGVRALRLTPINSRVFGRNGLLAHTYMLGPNGDSNGCVSIRNYDAFLQAYLNGEIKRLAVVASRG